MRFFFGCSFRINFSFFSCGSSTFFVAFLFGFFLLLFVSLLINIFSYIYILILIPPLSSRSTTFFHVEFGGMSSLRIPLFYLVFSEISTEQKMDFFLFLFFVSVVFFIFLYYKCSLIISNQHYLLFCLFFSKPDNLCFVSLSSFLCSLLPCSLRLRSFLFRHILFFCFDWFSFLFSFFFFFGGGGLFEIVLLFKLFVAKRFHRSLGSCLLFCLHLVMFLFGII
jgi:hypothetical protein